MATRAVYRPEASLRRAARSAAPRSGDAVAIGLAFECVEARFELDAFLLEFFAARLVQTLSIAEICLQLFEWSSNFLKAPPPVTFGLVRRSGRVVSA